MSQGDEVHGNSNIVDGQYVPWHAKIVASDIQSWEKDNSVLRPLVHRRFKEFEWLYNRLRQQFNGSIIPLLPPKRYSFMDSKFDTEFIESRKDALNEWLIYVGSHPLLSTSLDAFFNQLHMDCANFKTKSALLAIITR